MSTIVCAKVGSTVCLGSDSRCMTWDHSAVYDDAAVKISEVQPETFIAANGRLGLWRFQVSKARELALADVRELAEALDCVSRPELARFVESLKPLSDSSPDVRVHLAGEKPIHSTLLAGRHGGEVGFTFYEYWLRGGQIVCDRAECFSVPPGEFSVLVTRPGPVESLMADRATWADGAVSGVCKLLLAITRASELAGGPLQVVALEDGGGARWIHRLPAPAVEAGTIPKLAHLSVDAAKLANSSVTATKIANAAVGSAAIAALAVGTAHIADLAVTSAKIASLEAWKVTAGAIGVAVTTVQRES